MSQNHSRSFVVRAHAPFCQRSFSRFAYERVELRGGRPSVLGEHRLSPPNSVVAILNDSHVLFEVVLLEILEFSLVVLGLPFVRLGHLRDDLDLAVERCNCGVEVAVEVEALGVVLDAVEALTAEVRSLQLSLQCLHLQLEVVNLKVDLGGLTVVGRPLGKALEEFETDTLFGGGRQAGLVSGDRIQGVFDKLQGALSCLHTAHLRLQLVEVTEVNLHIDGLGEGLSAQQRDEGLDNGSGRRGRLSFQQIVDFGHRGLGQAACNAAHFVVVVDGHGGGQPRLVQFLLLLKDLLLQLLDVLLLKLFVLSQLIHALLKDSLLLLEHF